MTPDEAAVLNRLRYRGRLRGRLPVHQRRIDKARRLIAETLEHGPTCVLVSGGKDSVALLHLAREMQPDVTAIFVDDGAQLPWTYDVIAQLPSVQTIQTTATFQEMWRAVGLMGFDDDLAATVHYANADYRRVFVTEPQERIRDMGYSVHLMGLRAQESRGRMMNRRFRGAIYERKNGITVSTPITDWDGEDVFAYCTNHDLPLSPGYLQPDVPDDERHRLRTAAWATGEAQTAGEWARIRARFPSLWQELVTEFPKMARSA